MFSITLLVSDRIEAGTAVAVFAIVHLLLYPASNAFNSYYDRDEGSIGVLEFPPPVSRHLLYTALILDLLAIALGWFVTPLFALLLAFYGLSSKAYSYDRIRLKRYAILSWILVGVGQGAITIIMFHVALSRGDFGAAMAPNVLLLAGLASLFLMASYPLTQVYQHDADRRRGDRTISMLLGIRGTFLFSGAFFTIVIAGFTIFFIFANGLFFGALFLVSQVPTAWYFLRWFSRVRADETAADFRSAMRTNTISATGLNAYCLLVLIVGYMGAG